MNDRIRFLLDEGMPHAISNALRALEPEIEHEQVGRGPNSLPKSTRDPDIILFAEIEKRAIVTFDKETMIKHAANHIRIGQHTWGVFVFPHGHHLYAGQIAEELHIIWAASIADEWIDQVVFLP